MTSIDVRVMPATVPDSDTEMPGGQRQGSSTGTSGAATSFWDVAPIVPDNAPTQPLAGDAARPDLRSPHERSYEDLPQDGGTAQTASELLLRYEQTDEPRVQALFGAIPRGNWSGFTAPDAVPEGRDASYRLNDARAVEGLPALIREGKISSRSIVIGHHGHTHEILWELLKAPNLDASGIIRSAFTSGTDAVTNQRSTAIADLNSAQTYGDVIDALRRPSAQGAVYLGVSAHGSAPPLAALPSPETIRTVMGADANVVFVTEIRTGGQFDPASRYGVGTSFAEWIGQLRAAGIAVTGYGIDSRSWGRWGR